MWDRAHIRMAHIVGLVARALSSYRTKHIFFINLKYNQYVTPFCCSPYRTYIHLLCSLSLRLRRRGKGIEMKLREQDSICQRNQYTNGILSVRASRKKIYNTYTYNTLNTKPYITIYWYWYASVGYACSKGVGRCRRCWWCSIRQRRRR